MWFYCRCGPMLITPLVMGWFLSVVLIEVRGKVRVWVYLED
jgi:hypothetical protein